jgi:hypothetical protein
VDHEDVEDVGRFREGNAQVFLHVRARKPV